MSINIVLNVIYGHVDKFRAELTAHMMRESAFGDGRDAKPGILFATCWSFKQLLK